MILALLLACGGPPPAPPPLEEPMSANYPAIRALDVGAQVDDYVIIEPIARGGYGNFGYGPRGYGGVGIGIGFGSRGFGNYGGVGGFF